jgi:hypothetical protein
LEDKDLRLSDHAYALGFRKAALAGPKPPGSESTLAAPPIAAGIGKYIGPPDALSRIGLAPPPDSGLHGTAETLGSQITRGQLGNGPGTGFAAGPLGGPGDQTGGGIKVG